MSNELETGGSLTELQKYALKTYYLLIHYKRLKI